ncbi:LON peptidase N-terminal domain and RING finger protein 1-like [Montipora foliosa]|uniref:LON peptidase N-terminal domain and RING finger protein 1-like n=1 Tax=Montipora foliosa TaxID=591990 RepID=UPI0035F11FBF
MAETMSTEESSRSSNTHNLVNSLIEQGELYARTGRLDLSFRSFSDAFRIGTVPKECISSLVEACLEFQRTKLSKERSEEPSGASNFSENDVSLFTCGLCNSVFMKPVTLPCGHTFCEVCLSEQKSFNGFAECCKCGIAVAENTMFTVNVLVMNVVQKWLRNEYRKQEKKLEGMNFLIRNDLKSAIHCFSGVLSTSANDFQCLCWRSDAFLRMRQLDLALRDIEQACKLRPRSARSFYRKAVILSNFAQREGILSTRHEASVIALLRCYTLVPNSRRYRQEFTESLHQLLRPKFTNVNRTMSVLKQTHGGESDYPHQSVLQQLNLLRDKTQVDAAAPKGISSARMGKNESKTITSPASYEVELRRNKSSRGTEDMVTNVSSSSEGKVENDIFHLTEVEDFECKLCYNLLFQPVTTICGHTFCRECLERSLDHRDDCPCCRTKLDLYLSGKLKMEVTHVLQLVLTKHFPCDYSERLKKFEEKMKALSGLGQEQKPQVPIFVCTMAFPKVPCPLHIFEPRYRLMLRRCTESGSKQFGMCVGSEDSSKGFADYGTMLNVQTVNFLPDGRSIVHTVGGRRFHVLSRGVTDGYHTATVEWVEDERVDDEEELKQLIELNRIGHLTLQSWFSKMSAQQRQCITDAIGPVPSFDENLHLLDNGPDWVWWILAALPLKDEAKLIILGMKSMRERFQSVIRFLQLMLSWQNTVGGELSPSS